MAYQSFLTNGDLSHDFHTKGLTPTKVINELNATFDGSSPSFSMMAEFKRGLEGLMAYHAQESQKLPLLQKWSKKSTE